ncbi:MAG: hypothetical protein R3E31_22970 [Chloroflexota bacterium]
MKLQKIELLRTFGQQAAASIRNARLYREVGQLYTRQNNSDVKSRLFTARQMNAAK